MNKDKLISPTFSILNKIERFLWQFVYIFLFRFSPIPLFKYRALILKAFGSDIKISSRVYPSVKLWLPRNLKIDSQATLGPFVNVYNQGFIVIERNVIISQGVHLCASSHDYNDSVHPLVLAPIRICANAWVCTEAFIGPGVEVSTGAVVGARAVLTKNTESWAVYAGNPAKKINMRKEFK